MFSNDFSLFRSGLKKDASKDTLPVGTDARAHAQHGGRPKRSHRLERTPADYATLASSSQPRDSSAAQTRPSDAVSVRSNLTPSERRTLSRRRIVWFSSMALTQALFVSTIIALVFTVVKWKTSENLTYLIWFVISAALLIAAGAGLGCVCYRRRERRDIEMRTVREEGDKWYRTAREKDKVAQTVVLASEQMEANMNGGIEGTVVGGEVQGIFQEKPGVLRGIHNANRQVQHEQTSQGGRAGPVEDLVISYEAKAANQGRTWQKSPIRSRTAASDTEDFASPLTKPPTYASRASTDARYTVPQDAGMMPQMEHAVSPLHRSSFRSGDGHVRDTSGTTSSSHYTQKPNTTEAGAFQARAENAQHQPLQRKPTILRSLDSGYPHTPRASVLEQDIFRVLNQYPIDPNTRPRGRSTSLKHLTHQSLPALTEQDPIELPTDFHRSRTPSPTGSEHRMSLSALDIPKRNSSLQNWTDSVPALDPELRQRLDVWLTGFKNSPSLGRSVSAATSRAERPTTMLAEDGWAAFARFNVPPYPEAVEDSRRQMITQDRAPKSPVVDERVASVARGIKANNASLGPEDAVTQTDPARAPHPMQLSPTVAEFGGYMVPAGSSMYSGTNNLTPSHSQHVRTRDSTTSTSQHLRFNLQRQRDDSWTNAAGTAPIVTSPRFQDQQRDVKAWLSNVDIDDTDGPAGPARVNSSDSDKQPSEERRRG